jgi:O-succinylbenzoate synthase
MPEQVQFEFCPYARPFRQPIRTHHGHWSTRQGILLRLTQENGKRSYGEIAPLEWFGSESFAQALTYCQQLPQVITPAEILAIPARYPATQFGFSSAWQDLADPGSQILESGQISGLLPAGQEALSVWSRLYHQGYRTFKWKIGVEPIQTERSLLDQLLAHLPADAQLRLDANGGLTLAEAHEWLRSCQGCAVEFLEQPLPAEEFVLHQRLRDQYSTPIALDESIGTIGQAERVYAQGWRGIFIIKPAIAGSWQSLHHFVHHYSPDLVLSSVFETVVGLYHIGQLRQRWQLTSRAAGCGLDHCFAPDHLSGIHLAFSPAYFEKLWTILSPT